MTAHFCLNLGNQKRPTARVSNTRGLVGQIPFGRGAYPASTKPYV